MNEDEQRKRFEEWFRKYLLTAPMFRNDLVGFALVDNHKDIAKKAWLESARQNSSADDSPSPFREPFTNPASGMGIPKQ